MIDDNGTGADEALRVQVGGGIGEIDHLAVQFTRLSGLVIDPEGEVEFGRQAAAQVRIGGKHRQIKDDIRICLEGREFPPGGCSCVVVLQPVPTLVQFAIRLESARLWGGQRARGGGWFEWGIRVAVAAMGSAVADGEDVTEGVAVPAGPQEVTNRQKSSKIRIERVLFFMVSPFEFRRRSVT